ncbi:MAG: hypothetical protein ACRCR6_05245, partial [Plesiomonas sp.]
ILMWGNITAGGNRAFNQNICHCGIPDHGMTVGQHPALQFQSIRSAGTVRGRFPVNNLGVIRKAAIRRWAATYCS